MKNFPETRKDILLEALERCFDEMYRKSQPSVTWEEINQRVKDNFYGEGEREGYKFHYISEEEFSEICEKYKSMYNIQNFHEYYSDLIKDYFVSGGSKTIWVSGDDDYPGYKDYVEVEPFKEQLSKILNKEDLDKVYSLIEENFNNYRNYYRGNHELNSFNMSIMDLSPCSDKQTVIESWKKLGIDITIEDKIIDPMTGEYELPSKIEGYKPGLVFNYDTDEWVTPEELENYSLSVI